MNDSGEQPLRAESLQPTAATDYYLFGEHHARHRQQDEALASYRQALARQPDLYLSLLAAGVALGDLKEYKSAEAMLTGAIAKHPQTTLGYVKRGASRLGQGKVLLAQADFEKAIRLEPRDAALWIARAALRCARETRGVEASPDAPKQWFDKAVTWTDKFFAAADQGTADLSWNRRLTLRLLRDEAAALLGVTLPTSGSWMPTATGSTSTLEVRHASPERGLRAVSA